MLLRMRDCDQGQPGIAQGNLPVSQFPFKERSIALTTGASGEEIAWEMAEVEMQVRYYHNDPGTNITT